MINIQNYKFKLRNIKITIYRIKFKDNNYKYQV